MPLRKPNLGFVTSLRVKSFDELQNINRNLKKLTKYKDKEIVLRFNLEHYSNEILAEIETLVENLKGAGARPVVWVYFNDMQLCVDDLENLKKLEGKLHGFRVKVLIEDADNTYTIDETARAQKKANDFLKGIKEQALSPWEKYLAIYGFVTNLPYNVDDRNPKISENIISVLNANEAVCIGYSKLLEFMCESVGIPCVRQRLNLKNQNTQKEYYHESNVVYIKDDKYQIDCMGYADPCFDNINNSENEHCKYTYAFLPLSDTKCFRNYKFTKFYPETAPIYEAKKDEAIYEFFEDNGKIHSTAKIFGVEEIEKNGLVSKSNFDLNRQKACETLSSFFKRYKIPADIFCKLEKVPTAISPESLVALCFNPKENENLLRICLGKIKCKSFSQSGASKKRSPDDEKMDVAFCDCGSILNVYEYLKNQKVIQDISPDFVKNVLSKANLERQVFDVGRKLFDGSKAVPIEKFEKGIEQTFKNVWLKNKNAFGAREQAKLAITTSTSRARSYFDERATNCFFASSQGYEKI